MKDADRAIIRITSAFRAILRWWPIGAASPQAMAAKSPSRAAVPKPVSDFLDWFNRPRDPSNPDPEGFDQSSGWQPAEIRLDDRRTLVFEDF